MEVAGERHTPASLLPGKTRHLLYRRPGGPHGRPGRERKILSAPLLGFDPQTVYTSSAGYGTACLLQIRLLFFATPTEAKKLSPSSASSIPSTHYILFSSDTDLILIPPKFASTPLASQWSTAHMITRLLHFSNSCYILRLPHPHSFNADDSGQAHTAVRSTSFMSQCKV